MNPVIEMIDVTKRFGPVTANANCNLTILEGEIHCLLGENGAGKTTLMNILFGMYHADEGVIKIKGEPCVIRNTGDAFLHNLGMVHQHFMLISNMTVLQNIILGQESGFVKLNYEESRKKVSEIIDQYGLDIDLDAKVEDISVGMMQRVEIVKTLYRGADILVLDEPTAVLTPQESSSLMKILIDMKKQGKTIIFITHKLNETMEIADRATILRGGKVVGTVDIAGSSIQELANHMVGRDVKFKLDKAESNPGEALLKVDDVKLLKQATGTVTMDVYAGEILGIAGVDGNGQLELEETIMGLRSPLTGKIYFKGQDISATSTREIRKRGIGFIPSDRFRRAILPGLSLAENFLLGFQSEGKFSKRGIIDEKALKTRTVQAIEDFNVKTAGPHQDIVGLSGGNQQKLVLGREVDDQYQLVIASQPGRGLDIGAVEYIHTQFLRLRDSGKAVLLISADLEEIQKISDRIAVIYKGKLMACKPAAEFTREELGLLMAGKQLEGES